MYQSFRHLEASGTEKRLKKTMLKSSKFNVINETFTCEHCGKDVPISEKTCRNHCPYCLHSKHVDVFPGDRANSCKGLLEPVGYEHHKKKGLMILFRCKKCGEQTRNKALLEDKFCPDDYDKILSLSMKV